MTIDEIMNRQGEIEERKAQIDADLENPEADLDALNEEARMLAEETDQLAVRLDELKAEAQKAEEVRTKIAEGEIGEVKEEMKVEEKKMDLKEIRSSKEYVEAFAKYIQTGDDRECRSLLSTNAAANGQVPVPVLVDEIIKHAWETNELLTRVRKTAFRGNLKVPFERSADGAYVHAEGTTGLTEENLQIGVVELKPENIKKWIKISDEAVAMGGEEFVRYIYEEITYRVILKLVSELVGDVVDAPTTNSASAIGIPKVTAAPGVTTIADAAANLTEEARNLVVVMNRLTEQSFNAAYASANFAIDPFAGLPRVYTSALPAYASASASDTYAIVGDLSALQVNYPEGEGVVIKWDDLTYAEDDMVKVVGRQYAGHGVTAPGRLVRLVKGS